ncbi:DarT ssDNA thymidine ADP-ribosyltransferase family protein [Phenylobacterium sp.]|uniref:DarT ssDNA thymidine ADP-ribosyltransferase family protein n=1 Tax=Phenylobacterium sp. TaxID=1871053 RepID=UPI0030019135
MGLTAQAADAHIAHWQAELGKPYYPHRVHWPSMLFHHAPIYNAVGIIQTGEIRSRRHTEGDRPLDVAAAGVIENRDRAHEFSRLYFRPRTPTQYHIEGIRRPNECRYGPNAHAPVLVMFALDARSILTMPSTRFSNINMQNGDALDGDDDAFFATINFAKTYHEGGTSHDMSIVNHRAAEVLCQSPLILEQHLKWVICRSEAERDTLIHLAGPAARLLRPKIVTSDDGRVFEKRFAFVEKVYASPEGITFSINPRYDQAKLKVRVQVRTGTGFAVFDQTYDQLAARPDNGGSWISKVKLEDGVYRVTIEIDDHDAYANVFNVGEALF